MIALQNPATYFLTLIQQKGKSPNFWMSEEYIEYSGLKWCDAGGMLQGFKTDDGYWFFPYYSTTSKEFYSFNNLTGFQDDTRTGTFWDYEFIYDPKKFLDLSGHLWKIFRKNIRKHIDKPYEYRPIERNDEELEKVIQLFLNWVDGKTIFDPETFTHFVIQGENRFGLFLDGVLKGVNIADTNFKYINYRICYDDGELYLNEFLRWKFYTSEWVQSQNKLVNDGGSLGSDGLFRFKNKLNPVDIKDIFTGVEQ